MAKKKENLVIQCTGRLVEVGLDEEFASSVLRFTVTGAPDLVVTIPATQAQVKMMAPFLYEKVKITVEAV